VNVRAVLLVFAVFSALAPMLACAIGEGNASGSGFGLSGLPAVSATSAEEDLTGTTSASSSSGVDIGSTGVPGSTTGGSSGEVVGSSGDDSSTGGDCAGGCAAPGPCEVGPGECVAGECVYSPAGAEVGCDDEDPCTEDDACDGGGGCGGVALDCERPHASGGVCQAGVCQGFECVAPWADCNGDWDDGCEVPTGVANQCDANGLNADSGCWTAYCGSSEDPKAKNFAGFFCYDCSNCHEPEPGLWQWCDHSSGNWYASEAGSCGKFEDLVCAPP
jgi:hypothetical protein